MRSDAPENTPLTIHSSRGANDGARTGRDRRRPPPQQRRSIRRSLFSGSPFVPATVAPPIRVDNYLDLDFGHIISIGVTPPCR
jgi:hypothetical protein